MMADNLANRTAGLWTLALIGSRAIQPASTVYYIHLTGHQGSHTAKHWANIAQECNYSPLSMKAWEGIISTMLSVY